MSEAVNNAYAEAIGAVARAEGQASTVERELVAVASAITGSDELRTTLGDTKIPAARRIQIVEDLLGGNAAPATVSIVSLIVANGRVGDLEAIAKAVLNRGAAARGEEVAEVRSAVALNDEQIERLAAALKAKLHRDVTIRNIVDPSVLGGIITQVGETLLDGSVRTRMTQLREAF
ncbi:MAG: ATP synthase F1 subunit delta [Microthrixaceae bacterium]|nr:ATP synthase F1 subunit delta [Microthrixaceae bacterium]HPB45094.1 ATP synthase F1 subunit delta [Microthrixaceae bacterium]